MLKIALIALIALLPVAFLGGYGASIRSHGDWIPARDGVDCVAIDQNLGVEVGRWTRHGLRCHMSDFIWRQVINRPLRGWR